MNQPGKLVQSLLVLVLFSTACTNQGGRIGQTPGASSTPPGSLPGAHAWPATSAPAAAGAGAERGPGNSEPMVAYQMRVTLDTEKGQLRGRLLITWRNPADRPVTELYFHMYQNAFRPGTTMTRETGREYPGSYGGEVWFDALRWEGQDLRPAFQYVAPDDQNPQDRTLARVSLPRPVAPGERLELETAFTTTLPSPERRSGRAPPFYAATQWFPKLAVLEPAGRRGRQEPGWNAHQYHAWSEFYADFATYEVAITVPEGYQVAATGQLQGKAPAGNGQVTWTFFQDWVHDFAWAADTRFRVLTRPFRAPGLPETTMQLYLQPEMAGRAEWYFDALSRSLQALGTWLGPYPYATISLVDPPADARGVDGMEYPTLIMAGASPGQSRRQVAELVVHEFAHQYWYGLVANNEFEEAWLDEGFTTYTTSRLMEQFYGPPVVELLPGTGIALPFSQNQMETNRTGLLGGRFDPLTRNSWEFYNSQSYGLNVYPRAAVVLSSLEAYLGAGTFDRLLRTYFERWRYRHPGTADFQAVAEEVSGTDLDWFFDQYVRDSRRVDYAVTKAERLEVVVMRVQDGIFPVALEVEFEDGTRSRQQWDGRERYHRFRFNQFVRSARIDPEGKLLLDENLANNSYTRDSGRPAATRWGLTLTYLVQWLLHSLGLVFQGGLA